MTYLKSLSDEDLQIIKKHFLEIYYCCGNQFEKGNGSYLNNQRIRVSSRSKLKDCMIFTGGPKNTNNNKNKTNQNVKIS